MEKMYRLRMYLLRWKGIMNERLILFEIVPLAFNTFDQPFSNGKNVKQYQF